MDRSMNMVIISGALLAFLGIVGLIIPVFTTQQMTNVARVGNYQIQTEENTSHVIPPVISFGALGIGIVLVGGGLLRRRW